MTDTPKHPQDAERDAFEAWFCRDYHPGSLTKYPDGCYMERGAGMAWVAWQERAALAAPAQPEAPKPQPQAQELPAPFWPQSGRERPYEDAYNASNMRDYGDARARAARAQERGRWQRVAEAGETLTDAQMSALCRRQKLPRVMWDSEGFRGHLLRLAAALKADSPVLPPAASAIDELDGDEVTD